MVRWAQNLDHGHAEDHLLLDDLLRRETRTIRLL